MKKVTRKFGTFIRLAILLGIPLLTSALFSVLIKSASDAPYAIIVFLVFLDGGIALLLTLTIGFAFMWQLQEWGVVTELFDGEEESFWEFATILPIAFTDVFNEDFSHEDISLYVLKWLCMIVVFLVVCWLIGAVSLIPFMS